MWINAILGSPLAYLRHRAAHLNHNMRFMLREIPNDAVYVMSAPNPFGLRFTATPLAKSVSHAAFVMARSPLGRPMSWMMLAIGLLIVAPTLPSRRILRGLAASALAYGGAYAIVSVAADLRYNLWTLIAGLIGIAIVFAERRNLHPGRLAIALLPLALAAVLEMRALG